MPLLVQSFHNLTFNLLQQKCSQVFLIEKNVLYNILKVSQNLMGGSVKKFENRGDELCKIKHFYPAKQLYQVKVHSLISRMIPKSML